MAGFNIYATRAIRANLRRPLERLGSVSEWKDAQPVPREELLARVPAAEALLCTFEDHIDRTVIAAGARLRVISIMSAEVDNIDLQAAHDQGVLVCHTPGVTDQAIADMTMALLLACARNLIDADAFVKSREWEFLAPELFLGADVQGRAIGIIGLGHIGLLVSHRALGFGMRVLYYDPRRDHDAEEHLGIQFGSLENVLREADFVTLHLPLHPSAYGLLNEPRLRLMKPTAYLINVSRGPLIDQQALVRALRERWIAGAGLDVYEAEPLPRHDPLLDLPNVILSPHIGANTTDALDTMMRMAVEQVIAVLKGHQPDHVITIGKRAA